MRAAITVCLCTCVSPAVCPLQARAYAFKQLGEKPPPSSGGNAGGSGSCGGGGGGGAGAGELLRFAAAAVIAPAWMKHG